MISICRILPEKKEILPIPIRYKPYLWKIATELSKKSGYMERITRFEELLDPYKDEILKRNSPKYMKYLKKYSIIFDKIYYVRIYKILHLDLNKYQLETERLLKENEVKNKEIIEYNNQLDNIINKINNLKSWDEFVEFDGQKYGTPAEILDDKHIEDGCNGLIILLGQNMYECFMCMKLKEKKENIKKIKAFKLSNNCKCYTSICKKCTICDKIYYYQNY